MVRPCCSPPACRGVPKPRRTTARKSRPQASFGQVARLRPAASGRVAELGGGIPVLLLERDDRALGQAQRCDTWRGPRSVVRALLQLSPRSLAISAQVKRDAAEQ